MAWLLQIFVTLFLSTFTINPIWTMDTSDSGSEPYPESSVFSSQRPIINYRTKILGVRYGEPITTTTRPQFIVPKQISKSYETPKTEINSPIYDEEDEYEAEDYAAGVTEQLEETSTLRIQTIPAGLRRNFAFLVATTPSTPTTPIEESKTKPFKTKSNRRRKVKRPPKLKSTTSKPTEEDLGIPESPNNNTSSSGDKNLALEIGSGDGKYALISHFFGNTTVTKPPGVISYAQSNDFLTDNEKTLGNLEENDIWLSEGHLLVLKGGDFDSTSRDKWKPIDAYERDKSKPPLRIPLDTNNPPPFPVFINSSGPPTFIGPPPPFSIPDYGEFNESFDPSRHPPPGLIPLFPNGTIPEFFGPPPGFRPGHNPFPGFPPLFGPGLRPPLGGLYGNGSLSGPKGGLYGEGPPGNGIYGYGGGPNAPPPPNFNGTFSIPPPFYPLPPPGTSNRTRVPPPLLFPFGHPGNSLPPPPGFNPNFTAGPFPFLPPLVLNPKDNETDDPSIFLPPPYDFDYYEDNSTIVPPGPFAPGLVVPPPKDFYTVYNKSGSTTPFTTPIPMALTSPVGLFPFRPQRPNAKRPKFPITDPPDDSLEANLPPTTPTTIITFPKKRKRPGKYGKSYSKESEEVVSGKESPSYPILITTSRPQIFFKPRVITPTPTPLNYVYVRGKLKTLAEIAAEAAITNGFEKNKSPTSPPPFDELGYPIRNIEINEPNRAIEYSFPKKITTKEPPKIYLTGTHNMQNILYNNKNHNQETLGPTYYMSTPGDDDNSQLKRQPQLFQHQMPYSSNLHEPTNPPAGIFIPQQQAPSPTGGSLPQSIYTGLFQPTYNPPAQKQRKRPRSRIIFPDELDRQPRVNNQHYQPPQQPNPPIYNNPIIYQNPSGQGYYSPISQYKTALNGQFIPNTFYPNSGDEAFPGTFTTQFYQPQIQQQPSPFFQQYQQQPQNTYAIRQLPEGTPHTLSLHSDILVNYREPLPQYNTESESVRTRSIVTKAGPSSFGIYGNQPAGEGSSLPLSQGNFYSFERGGPGGFSYKIRL